MARKKQQKTRRQSLQPATGPATVSPNRRRGGGGKRASSVKFSQKLVLHQWLLGLFGVGSLDDLAARLKEESLEGLTHDNTHRFHEALCLHIPADRRPELPDERLLEYDQSIVSVTRELNERRRTTGEPVIVWKYFQYLALLFTEIYLDWYFNRPGELLAALNQRIDAINARLGERDWIQRLDESAEPAPQLNKIAFWMATGSGKTLVMHANLKQYLRHAEKPGKRRKINRIILLTPNEGLSLQHRGEFDLAGISADLFQKDAPSLYRGKAVEILEVTRLREEAGEKTVAVDSFEGNNLVLVDEGHRGATAGKEGAFLKARDKLCESGFSFEYSATFGQAVQGDDELVNTYARGILFDYSYRWFYGDGFGKDYQILNLEKQTNKKDLKSYLTACLLTFFQQQRLYREREKDFRPFQIERPLWVFVGSSVNAVRKESGADFSDVVNVLNFLRGYLTDREGNIELIRGLLRDGLVTASGRNLFDGKFAHLNATRRSPAAIYKETLETLFHAPGGGLLHVEDLKGAAGEIALRVGENEPFGVINVGDTSRLVGLCEKAGLDVTEREFAGSLFHGLNRPDSKVNLLIGSKKFSEGWSSWRVSTMGLMNVGRGEGLADHPVVWPRRATEGLQHESQAERSRRTAARSGSP
jgi:Type III restriction enzyme, res subunit